MKINLSNATSISEKTDDAINQDETIKNFALLIKKSQKDKSNEGIRSIIHSVENHIEEKDKYLIKMFLLNTQTGLMINSDNAFNIAFRVDTINRIFDSIIASIERLGINNEQANQIFFDAGRSCGESFGQHYNVWLRTYTTISNMDDKITEWCAFDSSVGFGKFSYNAEEKQIEILNNFQTNEYPDGEYPINCTFLQGYISGVLTKLIVRKGQSINFVYNNDDCYKKTDLGNGPCIIKFELEV